MNKTKFVWVSAALLCGTLVLLLAARRVYEVMYLAGW
jgi:hypothetical protein